MKINKDDTTSSRKEGGFKRGKSWTPIDIHIGRFNLKIHIIIWPEKWQSLLNTEGAFIMLRHLKDKQLKNGICWSDLPEKTKKEIIVDAVKDACKEQAKLLKEYDDKFL